MIMTRYQASTLCECIKNKEQWVHVIFRPGKNSKFRNRRERIGKINYRQKILDVKQIQQLHAIQSGDTHDSERRTYCKCSNIEIKSHR